MTFRHLLFALFLAPVSAGSSFASDAAVTGSFWVQAERLDKRTCPSEICGKIGHAMFQDAVTVLEVRDGWARITEFTDAACVAHVSQSVVEGNNRCVLQNGISNGQFAVWVPANQLVRKRPVVAYKPVAAQTKVLSWVKKKPAPEPISEPWPDTHFNTRR